jgi:outer membrane lipoprotein-sorting protein
LAKEERIMLPELMVGMVPGLQPDPVSAALARFAQVQAYQLTLRSEGGRGEEVIHYTYRQPGYIRMDLVTPYRGAVVSYRPDTREVQLWPFGSPGQRAGLTLSPTNRMVRSARGHRVDQSDVGTLLRNVQQLQRHGTTRLMNDTVIGNRPARHLVVEGDPGQRVGEVARYELWLDSEQLFPLKVVSYGGQGERLETVRLEDIVINPVLPRDVFDP